MAEIVKRVAIELGGATRHLVFDFNALAAMEEHTGREFGDLFEQLLMSTQGVRTLPNGEVVPQPKLPNATLVRMMLWAGLLADCPDLTLKEAGSWLNTQNLGAVMGRINEAFGVNAPEGKPEEQNPPAAPSDTPPVADAA